MTSSPTDIEHAKQYLIDNKSFIGYDKCDSIEVENPTKYMEMEVDYLIPAATEKSIHKINAPKL